MSLKEIINSQKATIIDVRNEAELAEGSFPGAINIPVQKIPMHLEEIKKMQSPLILYCRSGNRSEMAILMLRSAGIDMEMHNGGGYQDMLNLKN